MGYSLRSFYKRRDQVQIFWNTFKILYMEIHVVVVCCCCGFLNEGEMYIYIERCMFFSLKKKVGAGGEYSSAKPQGNTPSFFFFRGRGDGRGVVVVSLFCTPLSSFFFFPPNFFRFFSFFLFQCITNGVFANSLHQTIRVSCIHNSSRIIRLTSWNGAAFSIVWFGTKLIKR